MLAAHNVVSATVPVRPAAVLVPRTVIPVRAASLMTPKPIHAVVVSAVAKPVILPMSALSVRVALSAATCHVPSDAPRTAILALPRILVILVGVPKATVL